MLARGSHSGADEASCFSKKEPCSTPLGQRLRVGQIHAPSHENQPTRFPVDNGASTVFMSVP
jgi:hypothetical protein